MDIERTRVVNKYKESYDIYIGRGSKWGNPFIIGKDGDRDEVCDLYEKQYINNPTFIATVKQNLKGKDLVCFCAPKRCHGDFLLEVANE